MNFRITLTKQKDSIFWMCPQKTVTDNGNPYCVIKECLLLLPIQSYADNLFTSLKAELLRQPAKRYMCLPECLCLTIPKLSLNWSNSTIVSIVHLTNFNLSNYFYLTSWPSNSHLEWNIRLWNLIMLFAELSLKSCTYFRLCSWKSCHVRLLSKKCFEGI